MLLLALAGCGPLRVWHGRTPDRSHLVEVLESDKQQYVRIDGVEGPRFNAVPASALAFSADGKHVAYAAKQAAQWVVVANGTRGDSWTGIGAVVLSADGAHVAYAAASGKKWRVVHDKTAGPEFDSLFEGSLTFSPDGERLAYLAEDGGKKRVVVDGVVGPPLDEVGELGFSPDGTHVAYVANGSWVVRDGHSGGRYHTVRGLVQANGHHCGFVARRGIERFVVIDGREDAAHAGISGLTFSADGARFAYVAKDARAAVVVDGVVGPQFDSIDALAFSGGHVAYVGRAGKHQQVVRDGDQFTSFTRVSQLQQAGDHWAYLGTDAQGVWPVIDGHKRQVEPSASDLVLNADGRRFAYLARRGKTCEVVHDGGRAPLELVVEGSLTFGADGKRWACLAGDPVQRRFFIAIEGGKRVPFDFDELAGLAADRPSADPAAIRRWVGAEAGRQP